MYRILKQEGRAKRAELSTVHGVIQTPVFMNVGTAAAIKGAVSTEDLEQIKTQVELSNTYHLHVRPGDRVVKQLGGLHKFMAWNKPILTDSGGFQVFSLASLRKIKEEGVYFNSHIDGRKIFMVCDMLGKNNKRIVDIRDCNHADICAVGTGVAPAVSAFERLKESNIRLPLHVFNL